MMLRGKFQENEIKEAVHKCDGDNSPEPKKFDSTFTKRCWDTLKNEFIDMMQEFWVEWCTS